MMRWNIPNFWLDDDLGVRIRTRSLFLGIFCGRARTVDMLANLLSPILRLHHSCLVNVPGTPSLDLEREVPLSKYSSLELVSLA